MAQSTLLAARDNLDSLIATITASPNPNYSIDGKSVSKADYLVTLIAQRQEIEKCIMMADGPYEVRTQGY